MATTTLDAPLGAIATIEGVELAGSLNRVALDGYGNLERVEIELFAHLASHAGETAFWAYAGALRAAEVTAEEFSTPLPTLLDADGPYCWRARLRDHLGTWTAWTAKSTFTLTSPAPVISVLLPGNGDLRNFNGVLFSAEYADSGGNRASKLHVSVHLLEFGANPEAKLWDSGPVDVSEQHPDFVYTRYTGRILGAGDYRIEAYVVNDRGAVSNTLTSLPTLTLGYDSDPGLDVGVDGATVYAP